MQLNFISLDDALIERMFQPVADALSDRLGLERRRAACLCIDVASVGWILSQAKALSDAVMDWQAGTSFARMALLLLGLMALTGLRGLFLRLTGEAKGNPLRPAMRPHRMVVLLMLVARLVGFDVAGLAQVADLAMLGFAAVALYLGACAARPPVRRRRSALVWLR